MTVHIFGERLVVTGPDGRETCLERSQVTSVEMYKLDQITVDLICCDVYVGRGDGALVYAFHEDDPSWEPVLGWLAGLPGVMTDWYGLVVSPPFALNRTVIFRRDDDGSTDDPT